MGIEDYLAKFSLKYNGRTFPGYNKPVKSWRDGKKYAVVAKDGNKTKLLHFGAEGMKDFTQHGDFKRKKSFLARSGGIRDKNGNLTKNNKLSPNYWSQKTWSNYIPKWANR